MPFGGLVLRQLSVLTLALLAVELSHQPEPGVEIAQGEYSTADHLNVFDAVDLGIGAPFGTLVFDFTLAGGGFATAKYSAFGRFSLELNAACRSQ